MSKDNNSNTNEVQAEALNVYARLAYGLSTVKSSNIDLLSGYASIFVEHTGGSGALGVQIVDPTLIDEAVKTWILKPGEQVSYFNLKLPLPNRYYLKLYAPNRNASGSGRLGQPMSV